MSIFVGILLVLYICFLVFHKVDDLLRPSVIYSLLILSTYFLSTLRFSLLQAPYPIWFTALILSLIFIFYLGDKIASMVHKPNEKAFVDYSVVMMNILLFVVWFLLIFSFVKMVEILGPPPAISKGNRAGYFVSGWGTIVILQSSFFGLLLYDRFNKNASKLMFWVYCSSIILVAMLLSNKFQIIYMLVLFLISYNTFRKKIQIKALLIAALAIVGMFILLFEFVYKDMYGVSMDTLYIAYRMAIPGGLRFLTQPYLYVAFNYENLYHFIVSDTHSLHGLKTFGSILDLLNLRSLYSLETLQYLNEWRNLLPIPSMTTGTMFQDFVQDGGVPFAYVMTFISGFVSRASYDAFKINKNFGSFFLYAATTVAIFMSFFANVFTLKVTVMNVLIAYIFSLLLKVNLVIGKGR
ncbi:O-antigen polymerase [Streptococcus porcinus]